jgi:hypothetical protein
MRERHKQPTKPGIQISEWFAPETGKSAGNAPVCTMMSWRHVETMFCRDRKFV